MHLTLKKEATKPAAGNFLQQQARFDKFIEVFNNERPHEALDMKCPAEVYQPSPRPYSGLPDIDYPFHDKTIVVTRCGRICLGKKKINFSQVFAGQAVGIKEVHDDIWLVSFMDYDLGYFDLGLGCSNRWKIPSAQKCYLCLRYVCHPCVRVGPGLGGGGGRDSNPRDPFESNGFQDRRFQPLTHSSVSNSSVFRRWPAIARSYGQRSSVMRGGFSA